VRPTTEATAEGDLGKTPLAQLLAFTLEKRLTGTLYLAAPDGAEHALAFDRGAPVKLRPPDTFARLGELLVEDGALDATTLEKALATPGLLGDVLLIGEAVTSAALAKAVERQFRLRFTRLFALPAEAKWAFFEGPGELDDWGGDPSRLDPLGLLIAGVRAHEATLAPVIDATLARLGDAQVRASGAAIADRLGLTAEERPALELLQREPTTLAKAIEAGVVPERTLRRVAYGLLLARALGAPEPAASGAGASEAPPSSSRRDPVAGTGDEATSSAALARMKLRATQHRDGAAAPDVAGDGGERATFVPRKQRAPERSRLPQAEAYSLAVDRAAAGDPAGALEALGDALAQNPDSADYRAYSAWLRAELPGADRKAITIELDELCARHPEHVAARYYRGAIRARLSNAVGAASDLRRVLELEPGHVAAQKLLATLEPREAPKPSSGGLFARLFKR
jgi:hypothetical protein